MSGLTYYKVDQFQNFPTIRLGDIEVFEQMIAKHKPDHLFVSKVSESVSSGEKDLIGRDKAVAKEVTLLAFTVNNLIYTVNSNGFESLEDAKDASNKGYAAGDDFYAAKEGNFVDKEEYDLCKAAGFGTNRVEYLKAKSSDFVGAYRKLEQAYIEGRISDDQYKELKKFGNDARIYEVAGKNEFESYEEFENAFVSGFVKADADAGAGNYRAALEKGFADSKSYYSAVAGDFDTPDAFEAANAVGINNREEFERYQSFNTTKENHGFRTMEQTNLFLMLSELSDDSQVGVDRIWEMVKDAETNIQASNNEDDGKSFWDRPIIQLFNRSKSPSWYTTSFKDIVELKVFLISNDQVADLGYYDADTEVFTRGAEGVTVAAEATADADADAGTDTEEAATAE